MKERALVLGGGGPAGIAWEVGLVAGLALAGVDVGRADLVLGTSAGSFLGAQIVTGIDPQVLAQMHVATSQELARRGHAPQAKEPLALYEFMRRMPQDSEPPRSLLMEMGQLALSSETIAEAEFVSRFNGMFGPTPTWSPRYGCTAVRARDGEFKIWTLADHVDLQRAVAASCAVPGVFPPVTLNGEAWMDGGARSWTNADCAAGHRKVIVAAVVLPINRKLHLPVLERERKAIEAAGGEAVFLMPDDESLAAMGGELMGAPRGAEITAAGTAQGQREGAALKAFWS